MPYFLILLNTLLTVKIAESGSLGYTSHALSVPLYASNFIELSGYQKTGSCPCRGFTRLTRRIFWCMCFLCFLSGLLCVFAFRA